MTNFVFIYINVPVEILLIIVIFVSSDIVIYHAQCPACFFHPKLLQAARCRGASVASTPNTVTHTPLPASISPMPAHCSRSAPPKSLSPIMPYRPRPAFPHIFGAHLSPLCLSVAEIDRSAGPEVICADWATLKSDPLQFIPTPFSPLIRPHSAFSPLCATRSAPE
ncbi:hypothetical protein B0T14DRAFT_222995 [Immersiella caudata]|uniref:Uncharacterized protein n=1 Tax=Immersiella caudata TaxID=314043 RepID=A0AA40BZP5_9PEZI|nr:hypothetical protein B0T14DRAFT_222995 [Immersiella caudata]